MTKVPLARRWPCVIASPLLRKDANDLLARLWHEDREAPGYPPYSAFARLFRSEHCATLNPYGSESCPYLERDCVMAYLTACQRAIEPSVHAPVPFFRWVAKSLALERADNKPLTRDNPRTVVREQEVASRQGRPGRSRDVRDGDEPGSSVRRAIPSSIGSLFGTEDT
jgi:hypothetical protein